MTDRRLEPTPEQLARVADGLRAGGLAGMPTETVYGLAADATDPDAVARVYAAKGRPSDNPLIVHVADPDRARTLVSDWSEACERLVRRFWPGPLTLVLPHGGRVGPGVTAGHATVALRSPAHETAQGLLLAVDRPLVAPSANRSGEVSPTTAEHVLEAFPDEDFPVLDGGPCRHGIESTVLALADEVPVVLRPGR